MRWNRVRSAQYAVMNSLLQTTRIERLIEQSALDGAAGLRAGAVPDRPAPRHLERPGDACAADRPVPAQRADRLSRHVRQPAERRRGSDPAVARLLRGELSALRAQIVAAVAATDRSRLAPPPRGCPRSNRRNSRSTRDAGADSGRAAAGRRGLRPTTRRSREGASISATTCSRECPRPSGPITRASEAQAGRKGPPYGYRLT